MSNKPQQACLWCTLLPMELQVLQQDQVVHRLAWEQGSLTIGRAPDNDLILRDPDVSGHHAVLYHKGAVPYCRDLGSTNGLFLNGKRIVESALSEGDLLGLGGLQLRLAQSARATSGTWLLRKGPVAVPILSGESVDGHPEAVLFVEDDGVWLDHAGKSRLLEPGAFTLGEQELILEVSTEVAPTVPRDQSFPYDLEVDLGSNRAVLHHEGLDEVTFRAEARVALLYVLARSLNAWVDDTTLGTGIWGREWVRQTANNLNVLIHRTRKQAQQAGYDRRFLERRRGALRLRIADAIVR